MFQILMSAQERLIVLKTPNVRTQREATNVFVLKVTSWSEMPVSVSPSRISQPFDSQSQI